WTTLAAGVACFAGGVWLGRHELMVAASFALLLAFGGLLLARLRRPKLDVVRLFSPPVVSAGSSANVTLRVRNAGTVTTPTVLWNDAIPWQERQEPNELGPIRIRPASARTVALPYELHPHR